MHDILILGGLLWILIGYSFWVVVVNDEAKYGPFENFEIVCILYLMFVCWIMGPFAWKYYVEN